MAEKLVHVGFRATESQKAEIDEAARIERRLVSDFCRITITDRAKEIIEEKGG